MSTLFIVLETILVVVVLALAAWAFLIAPIVVPLHHYNETHPHPGK